MLHVENEKECSWSTVMTVMTARPHGFILAMIMGVLGVCGCQREEPHSKGSPSFQYEDLRMEEMPQMVTVTRKNDTLLIVLQITNPLAKSVYTIPSLLFVMDKEHSHTTLNPWTVFTEIGFNYIGNDSKAGLFTTNPLFDNRYVAQVFEISSGVSVTINYVLPLAHNVGEGLRNAVVIYRPVLPLISTKVIGNRIDKARVTLLRNGSNVRLIAVDHAFIDPRVINVLDSRYSAVPIDSIDKFIMLRESVIGYAVDTSAQRTVAIE